jgi:hypothetical protein
MQRVAALLVAACAWTAVAQESVKLPSGRDVIERYIQALGGKQALAGITSRVAMGSVESPTFGSYGRYVEFAKQPNRLLRAFQVERYGVVQQCFDRRAGWTETPEYGIEELTGQRLVEMRRDAEFEDALKLSELYSALVVTRRTKIEERDVFELAGTYPDEVVETLFFSVETGLLVCRESPETARDGSSRRVRTYFEDYAEVGAVQVAQTLRYVSPDLIRIVRRAVSSNAPVDDNLFRRPPGNTAPR